MNSLYALKIVLAFIALFHFICGAGLMFSADFQIWLVKLYGATLEWTVREVYFTRIIGSFAFVMGTFALVAAKDPLKHPVTIIALIEFFMLRNICRHLYAEELYLSLGVSSLTNTLTSFFFGGQAMLLAFLLFRVRTRQAA